MSTIITRDEAKQLINSVFATFAVSPSPDPIRDTAEAIRFKQGLATLADLHEKPDYKEALEALSMEGFTEYFNLIGSFWKLMGGDSAKKFTHVRLVSAKTLGEPNNNNDDFTYEPVIVMIGNRTYAQEWVKVKKKHPPITLKSSVDSGNSAEFVNVEKSVVYFNSENATISETQEILASKYKIANGFYDKYTAESMKDYWAESRDNTKCSDFLPDFIKGLNEKAYSDIFTNGKESANALFITFEKNPNLLKLGNTVNAAQKANDLATLGYLVIAAADNGGHVAVVGPQSLSYGSYPSTKWEGHSAAPFQEGTGLTTHVGTKEPKILYDYPVFLQAGSYTGVVNPGNAFSRSLFNVNEKGEFKVHFYLYKPKD